MPEIRLLDKAVAELIAAGEVIEKPASVIKELVENSIDAGARHITVEIRRGGIEYMRITDDGCGIEYSQLPLAFMRHATSKLRTSEDLFSVLTMGFRGEALASVAAVAKVEIMTRRPRDELGGRYIIEGGEEKLHEQCGCPVGTTIVIRDLFYNTPARRKFLKKDISEGNYIAAAVDRLALANPDIAFRFIRDNKAVRQTPGDGKLIGTIRSIYGRQTADSFVNADYIYNGIEVKGYVSSPLFCRPSRSLQVFFVNGRYIKSTTCMAAVEEGYRNSIMTGKYPACILDIKIPPEAVDVNVHPAKTEVKFSNDKQIFDAVYLATKNALLNCSSQKREIDPQPKSYKNAEDYFRANPDTRKYEQQILTEEKPVIKSPEITKPADEKPDIKYIYEGVRPKSISFNSPRAEYKPEKPLTAKSVIIEPDENDLPEIPEVQPAKVQPEIKNEPVTAPVIKEEIPADNNKEEIDIRVIGEFAKTYILCEKGEELIIIDKHAAHERIRFEQLKKEFCSTSQLLLDKTEMQLSHEEYNALKEYYEYVEQAGVELIFGDDFTVEITALPSVITCPPRELISFIAQRLIQHNTDTLSDVYDELLHSMACKSAIRANDKNDITELEALAKRVFADEKIRFCPHGRPVMTVLTKSRLERFFNRS